MGRKYGRKRNWALRAASVLLIMVMVTSWKVTGLLARFTQTDSADDQARTAAFVFRIQDNDEQTFVDLSQIEKPGDEMTYVFKVTNESNGVVCETGQQYTVDLTLNSSLPLVCSLAKGDESPSQISGSVEVQTLSSGGVLPAAVETVDTYVLTVQWPAADNDLKYANGSGLSEILLSVVSEQVD